MIVFLDDDPEISILIEKNFSNFGDEVRIFNSSKKLESEMDLGRVDILCFDIKLNNESGLDFIQKIRKDYPKLSFVCFSNYSELMVQELESLGILYHVDKQVGLDVLKEELIELLEERELLGLKAS